MRKTDAFFRNGRAPTPVASLYRPGGGRKYLTAAERRKLLATARGLPADKALFLLTLLWTGARLSEVLALGRQSFLVDEGVVAVTTLKRRRHHVREIPLPCDLVDEIDRHFRLRRLADDPPEHEAGRLWPWSRTTAWRIVRAAMAAACIDGPRACARGVRHSFGVGTLQSGVPITLVQRWLGHARLTTTAIYADATGPEETAFAARFWRSERGGRAGA